MSDAVCSVTDDNLVPVPTTFLEPFRWLVKGLLRVDPAERVTLNDATTMLEGLAFPFDDSDSDGKTDDLFGNINELKGTNVVLYSFSTANNSNTVSTATIDSFKSSELSRLLTVSPAAATVRDLCVHRYLSSQR